MNFLFGDEAGLDAISEEQINFVTGQARAEDAAGLAIVDGALAAPHVKDGSLIQVLEDWMAPFPGFFLYYPQRAQQPAAITAVIETFRLQR